jgi:hypothetical protein
MGRAGQIVSCAGGEDQALSSGVSGIATPEPAKAYPSEASPDWRPSSIVVLVPADRARAWSHALVDVLGARFGLPTELRRVPGLRSHASIPSEDFEQRLLNRAQHGHSGWIQTAGVALSEDLDDWSGRLVINTTGHDPAALPTVIREATVISPTFHGQYGAEALAIPLADGEPVHLGVVASRGGAARVLYGARLSAPDRTLLRGALDVIFARAISLVGGAADHLIRGSPLPVPVPAPVRKPMPAPPAFWARRLARAGLPRLGRQLGLREAWRIGVRRMEVEAPPEDLNLDPATFRILQNAPGRFYADPFVLRYEGTTAVFFEDYDFGAERAHISRVVLGQDGEIGPARPALQRPYHLSYPFAFVHDGAALMLPESSANRTIELYEAEAFPDRWRLRRVLIEGIDASDNTLHYDGETGLWWIFSSVSEFGGSSHDSLSIFFSEQLEGPWRPHPGNPVKLDPASSRPAGPLLPRDGRLFRPAQNCARTYGGSLAWCEVKQLDPRTFREESVPLAEDERSRRFPVHTYGRAAGFEVVDYKFRRWGFPA